MDLFLKDKVFIVTGGGAGIGGAISQTLLDEGAKVAIVARSPLSEETAKRFGERHYWIQTELSDEKACEHAVSETIKRFGRLDGLVNNAGVNDNVSLEHSVSDFRQSLEKNLTHYFAMMHYALPYLRESKGAVVNIGSKTAWTGQGQTSGYCAANGGRAALTREWAAALLSDGIRVNMVVPAEVMTPLYRRWIDSFENSEEKLQSIVSKIPLEKRMTTPEEIAAMSVFLLSPRSAHTTGQQIFVDGGYTHLDRSLT
ncbi:MAG: SDR family oxidoreductase [Cardiobacteriaceae bacterium]|nr:SDR family oxidoreductase [Cardiobacteriaceae bacterium]